MFPPHLFIRQYDTQHPNQQFYQNENPNVAASLFHQKVLISKIPSADLSPSRISAASPKAADINPLKRPRQTTEQDSVKKRKTEAFPPFQGEVLQSDGHLLQKLSGYLKQTGANLAIWVIENNGSVEFMKFVTQKLKANPNGPNESGQTPLLIATENQDIPMVKALIDLGADPNQVNEITRENPLFVATINGHHELIRILVEYGADPTLADNITGDIPLHGAVLAGNMGTVELFVNEFHVDPNSFNKITGETPLLLAVNDKNFAMTRHLVKKLGANPDCANQNTHTTPLLRAIEDNCIEMVRVLVSELGADPNLIDTEGRTPWIEATASTHCELAKELESLGANVEYGREYLDRIYLAHVWSIEGESVLGGHKFNLGGLPPEYSLAKISEHLELFSSNHSTPLSLDELKTIKETMNLAYPFVNLSADEIFDRIQARKPYAMVVNAEEHAIGIIFREGEIVVCNRGYGSTAYAIEFFSYDASNLTIEVIDQLKVQFDTVDSLFELLSSLNTIYLGGIPQNDQYANNCSWKTSKSILYVVFYIVLENHELSRDIYKKLSESAKTLSYDSYLRSSPNPDHKLIEAIRKKQIEKEEIDYATYLLFNINFEKEFFNDR